MKLSRKISPDEFSTLAKYIDDQELEILVHKIKNENFIKVYNDNNFWIDKLQKLRKQNGYIDDKSIKKYC